MTMTKSAAKLALVNILLSALAVRATPCATDEDELFCQLDDRCYVAIHSQHDPLCRMDGRSQFIEYMSPEHGDRHYIPNACARSNVFDGDGYLVAYPSRGGVVLIRDPPAVDLQYLGLPNTRDTERSTDGSEDDDLAARMLRLGADWWPDWDTYFRHTHYIEELQMFYSFHFPSKVDVAFPAAGGAWVGNFTRDSSRHMLSEMFGEAICDSWLPYMPATWYKKIRYALTMEQKAEVMKDLGATFYESADQIPGLPRTIDEAITLFEPFRKRLSDMDDPKYRSKFCKYDPDIKKHDNGADDENVPGKTPQESGWTWWPEFPLLDLDLVRNFQRI